MCTKEFWGRPVQYHAFGAAARSIVPVRNHAGKAFDCLDGVRDEVVDHLLVLMNGRESTPVSQLQPKLLLWAGPRRARSDDMASWGKTDEHDSVKPYFLGIPLRRAMLGDEEEPR